MGLTKKIQLFTAALAVGIVLATLAFSTVQANSLALTNLNDRLGESRGIWDLSWGRWLPVGDAPALVTGYSCRSQAHRFADLHPRHPVEALNDHLKSRQSRSAP